ncbi:MAG TPA: hydroxyisourate hydrolase [Thermoanaerobaculia bacterium]|nr:hydroxyisourate hydrolase [Thermoanaerobaculia bacterium]
MSGITTHVLDMSVGLPAGDVPVRLEIQTGDSWRTLGSGRTDADGRLRTLLPEGATVAPGVYRISFDTASYFSGRGMKSFFPSVAIVFTIEDPSQHYHVPLLLSPFGYSTYRGS